MSCAKLLQTLILLISISCAAVSLQTASATSTTPQTAVPAPTPFNNGALPVVSPDGRYIAFSSNRDGQEDVYVIKSDGSGENRVTHTQENEGNVAWYGKQILFSVFANDNSRLFVIDPDGKNLRQLATVPGRGPTASPNGSRLVYMAGTWTATKLMVSALDGSDAKQINDGSSIAWNNHWSPDGKQIAFTGRNDPKSELAVFVMNVDGSSLRQVSHVAAEEGGAQWPVWSPNGRELAVQVNSRTTKNSAHIWIVNVANGSARKLAPHDAAYLDETPSWFPNGKRLAFQSNRTGRMEVWVMDADGRNARQVTGRADH